MLLMTTLLLKLQGIYQNQEHRASFFYFDQECGSQVELLKATDFLATV